LLQPEIKLQLQFADILDVLLQQVLQLLPERLHLAAKVLQLEQGGGLLGQCLGSGHAGLGEGGLRAGVDFAVDVDVEGGLRAFFGELAVEDGDFFPHWIYGNQGERKSLSVRLLEKEKR
jgi:hypothetical protein